jgi:hypothetical protein
MGTRKGLADDHAALIVDHSLSLTVPPLGFVLLKPNK